MYYIEKENNDLVKYEVEIDKEKLTYLKKKIIEECGEITHKSYNSTSGPNKWDIDHICNYSERKIGRTKTNDELTYPSEDLYHYEYDEYKDTKLVNIINRLIDGDTNTILELKNPTPEEKIESTEDRLNKKIQKILSKSATDIDIVELDELKNKLIEFQKSKKINKDRKSDLDYYPEVLNCITLKEVSRMAIETLKELNCLYSLSNDFFKNTTTTNINPNIDKELYKILVIK